MTPRTGEVNYKCPECKQEHRELAGGNEWFYAYRTLFCKKCGIALKARWKEWKR